MRNCNGSRRKIYLVPSDLISFGPISLRIDHDEKEILGIFFSDGKPEIPNPTDGLIEDFLNQWKSILEKKAERFEIPYKGLENQFQREVLEIVERIPTGVTRTYLEIAQQLGGSNMTRAVARAIATNPYPILIPCHRVLGKNGELRGYLGGVDLKYWLLKEEGINLPAKQAELFYE